MPQPGRRRRNDRLRPPSNLSTVPHAERIIEFLLELLAQILLEILGQILFEIVAALGWESLKDTMRSERESTPLLAGIGHFLTGVAAGVVGLLVFGRRLTGPSIVPGASLILAPVGTGIAMHWLGELWEQRGRDRPALFTFRAGAIFAFGMALIRFAYLEIHWRPF